MTTLLKALRSGDLEHAVTGYPLHGAVVSPNDNADLGMPGYVRANDTGDISAIPYGSTNDTQLTLTMSAGEFFPCLVKRVRSTGTTVTTIHVFY